jgi:hypothetical protein
MSIKRIKARLSAALILTLIYCAEAMAQSVTPAPQAAVTLRLDQARAIAVQALEQGNPALALEIASGLLQADAQSFFAHMLVAQAQHQLAQPAKARKAAAAAYRFATTTSQKFAASQFAARLAVEDGRFTWSQFWLRRSLVNAPDPALLPQIQDDFRRVRAMAPLQLRLAVAVAPSSNVNNGSDSAYALIEGVPVIGRFDGLSQALSGVTASADLALSYRLAKTANSETRAQMRTYLSRVWLDEGSLALANSFPGADVVNKDFTFVSAETGLRQAFRLDNTPAGGLVSGEVTAGKTWYGGEPYQHFGRAVASHSVNLAEATRMTIAAELEKRVFERGLNQPVLSRQLQGVLEHRLDNADRISLGISLRESESDSRNANSTRKLAYLRYDLAEPVGLARLSFTLGAAQAEYPDYAVGFIFVPGGRQDETRFGSVGILFEGLDYAGFAPSLTIRAQRTRSNVSRFETSEMAVSLGIQSRF